MDLTAFLLPKRLILLGTFFAFLSVCATAQTTAAADSPLKLWIETTWIDSSTVHLEAKVLNQSDSDELYYYAIRTTQTAQAHTNPVEKIKGIVFCPLGDTVTAYHVTKTYKPDEEINIFFYLLENEYVVAFTVWSLDQALAQKNNTPPKKTIPLQKLAKDEFDIGGLVINETRTRFGKDFFQKFLENWKAPEGAEGFWINIREKPTNGRFTIISITLNNREIFQRHLIPSPDFVKNLASQLSVEIANLLAEGNYDGGITNEDLFGKDIE